MNNKKSLGEWLVEQQIKQFGPMRFDHFVDIALYHPKHGYYSRATPQRGREGDYFTSMQTGGLLPGIFASALKDMRDALGPEQFCLIELGSGTGEFLESLLTQLAPSDRKGLKVWAVEKSSSGRDAIWRKLSRFPKCEVVASLDDIDWMGGLEGCVFSNEFFDALPFRRLRKVNGVWREICVQWNQAGLHDLETEVSEPGILDACGIVNGEIPDGFEVEIRPNISTLYDEISQKLSRGYMITVDYGYARPSLGFNGRINGTYRCFYKHQLNANPLEHIGQQDITADVDFTQLAEAGIRAGFQNDIFCSQGIFLSHVGQQLIQSLLSSEKSVQTARAVQQLIHPGGMGEKFSVLVQSKTADLPSSFQAIPNRVRRLGLSDEKFIPR